MRTVVANTFTLVLGDPGDVVRGSVPLTVTLYNPSTIPSIYRVEYAVAGTTTWRTITGCSSAHLALHLYLEHDGACQ